MEGLLSTLVLVAAVLAEVMFGDILEQAGKSTVSRFWRHFGEGGRFSRASLRNSSLTELRSAW
jgi:hypothetical protein